MSQNNNQIFADRFQSLSLRSTNSIPLQKMTANGAPPSSPTAKRIVRHQQEKETDKRVKDRRNAFKMGGKSRSLGNTENIMALAISPSPVSASAPNSSPPKCHKRPPTLAVRSESVNRHNHHHHYQNQLSPNLGNLMGPLRKSSDAIYGKKNQLIMPMDGNGGGGISANSQHIIHFCLDNARGDLSARVLTRMAHKRPDFAIFCANLGPDNWSLLGDKFRQFLADVVANLQSTENIRNHSMKFGGNQVSWRSFGFKADFFAEMASALTMECIFLDGAAHPPSNAFEAWAELIEMMFSAVRDGYYSRVRHLRRSNNPLGNSQSMMYNSNNMNNVNNKESSMGQRQRTLGAFSSSSQHYGGGRRGSGHSSLEIQ